MASIFRTLLVVLFSCHIAVAQNIRPVQNYSTPMLLNPALTGLTQNGLRAFVNYSSENNGFLDIFDSRLNVSVDTRIMTGILPTGDAIGIGLGFQQRFLDLSGRANIKSAYEMPFLSIAYHKSIGKSGLQHISLGTQIASYKEHYRNYNTTSDPLEDESRTDNNIGIAYSGRISKSLSLSAGYSVNHILAYRSYPAYEKEVLVHTLYTNAALALSSRFALLTSITYRATIQDEVFRVGSYLRYSHVGQKNGKARNLAFYGGLWYLHDYLLCPYIGIEKSRFRLGLSYKIRTYHYNYYSYRGGYELSLGYSGNFRKQSGRWHCPVLY